MSLIFSGSKIAAVFLYVAPALAISDSPLRNPANIDHGDRSHIQLASADKLKTLIVSGFGSSLNDAIQNAAANALREVVGSFLSAESLLDKRVLIEKGIRSETRNITKSISEYSQGSIKSLDVLSSSTSNGIHTVNAKVVVRILDFRAYVKKLSSDSKELSKNIFAQISSEQSQEENRIEILERYISQLANGDASEITMQSAVRLRDVKDKNQYGRIIDVVDPDTTVAIPFKVSIKEGFKHNLLNTLNETADQKLDVYGKFNQYSEYNPYTPRNDYGLIYIDPINNIRSKFTFIGTGKSLKERYGKNNYVHPMVHGINCRSWIPLSTFERLGWDTRGFSISSNSIRCDQARKKRFSPLLVSLLDASGNVVLQDKINRLPNPTYDGKDKILITCKRTSQYGGSLDGCNRGEGAFSPYGFSGGNGTIPTIFKERNFLLLVQIPPATLGEVASIEIKVTGQ